MVDESVIVFETLFCDEELKQEEKMKDELIAMKAIIMFFIVNTFKNLILISIGAMKKNQHNYDYFISQ